MRHRHTRRAGQRARRLPAGQRRPGGPVHPLGSSQGAYRAGPGRAQLPAGGGVEEDRRSRLHRRAQGPDRRGPGGDCHCDQERVQREAGTGGHPGSDGEAGRGDAGQHPRTTEHSPAGAGGAGGPGRGGPSGPRGGRPERRRVGAESGGRRPQDQGGERRLGQACSQGGGAGSGHHSVGKRPVSFERRHLAARCSDAPGSGCRRAGRQGPGRHGRGPHRFQRFAGHQPQSVAAAGGVGARLPGLAGFPTERIVARGMGSDRPIAENTNAEGRANNRRVEIVIAKAP